MSQPFYFPPSLPRRLAEQSNPDWLVEIEADTIAEN
jgi:hypothetical protein